MRRLALLLALTLETTACAPTLASAPFEHAAEAHLADRLYFGRSIPGGGTVPDDGWADFLREVVTPRFPAGLTVLRAEGQWRDGSGTIIEEESFVLELIHPPDPAAERAIAEIVAEYRARFGQESVMHTRHPVRVRF